MAGRKIRDAAEARTCLTAAKTRGVPPARWAREHGIDGRSLNAWRVNLGRRPAPAQQRLVELVPATASGDPARYVVRFGELAVELDDRFDEATLSRLLRVVTAC